MPDYTIKQLAAEMSVSYKTIYRAVELGELGAYRAGRILRIPEAEVNAYKERRRVVPYPAAPQGYRHPVERKQPARRPKLVWREGMKVV